MKHQVSIIQSDIPFTAEQILAAVAKKYTDFDAMLERKWEEHGPNHFSDRNNSRRGCGNGKFSAEVKYLEQRRSDGKFMFQVTGFRDKGYGGRTIEHCVFNCGKINLSHSDLAQFCD